MTRLTRLAVGAGGVALAAAFRRERNHRRSAERMAAAALETLLNAIDANDAQTGAHVRRVAAYALAIAEAADLSTTHRRTVERVALFHDIGKIHEALFDIIHDEDELSPDQRQQIATHPARGSEVLAPLSAFYPELASGVLSHHERWDGSGYPRGLKGRRIPVAARIVALADTFDAITHQRRYRSGRSAQHAADAITAGRGTQFDPTLVDLMLSPPVWEVVVKTHCDAHAPRERSPGRAEGQVPDVTFRWRSKTVGARTDGA